MQIGRRPPYGLAKRQASARESAPDVVAERAVDDDGEVFEARFILHEYLSLTIRIRLRFVSSSCLQSFYMQPKTAGLSVRSASRLQHGGFER